MLAPAHWSRALSAILAPAVLLALLTQDAAAGANPPIFDYAPDAAEVATERPAKASGKTEKPKLKSAPALLGAYQTGPGYAVQPEISSDGRYQTYMFATGYGTYAVIGDDLARQHIQELIALDMLKQRSKTMEFVGGVGSAVASPVKGVIATVRDPVGATKATYSSLERKVESVQRGVSRAGEYITTLGNPEKRRPDREDDGLFEKLVGRPEVKRRLARELMVDPYSHFVPLTGELDKVASYSAAGSFGVDRAAGFVPGPAGIAISSLKTLDSLTKQTLDMDPEETAAINRKRLKQLDVPDDTIKELLLNDKLTPTEKTLVVGYLNGLYGTAGLDLLASLAATSNTRHGAYAALLTLSYLSTRPFGENWVRDVEIVERVLILTMVNGKTIAILTADDLAWTPQNAEQLARIGDALKVNGNKGAKEIRISGSASPLAIRELQRLKWTVTTDAFRSLR
jgi:hypothetical protein